MSSPFEGTNNQKKERAVVLRQLLQQRLRLFQIARVKAIGEPAVHRIKQFARLTSRDKREPEGFTLMLAMVVGSI